MKIQPKDTSRGHFLVSLVKSFVRIVAGTGLLLGGTGWIAVAGGALIVAELLGILEELV
jgi:hypothetical protein